MQKKKVLKFKKVSYIQKMTKSTIRTKEYRNEKETKKKVPNA